MLRPRSPLGLALRIVAALALIAMVSAVLVWNSGRVRLERALAELRASGGPEFPPQEPETTEGGRATEAWFAQFCDGNTWERDELDSTRTIEAFLAAHTTEPAVVAFAAELRVLADSLRIRDEEIAVRRKELEHPEEWEKKLAEMLGTGPQDALTDLEYDRAHDKQEAAEQLLEQQVPLESWDPVSRAWIMTRGLGHAEFILRAGEIAALDPFDPPAARGVERWSIRAGPNATTVMRGILDALPAAALRGDWPSFARLAAAGLACGRLYSRGWGLVHEQMNQWAVQQTSRAVCECLPFLARDLDLRAFEDALMAWNPRASLLEALRRERAAGNEFFLDFGADTSEAAPVTDGRSFIERECLRLWLNHERAGYLEMLGRAIELAPRPPCETPGGLAEWERILEVLRPPRIWKVLRSAITPNLRQGALMVGRLEVERDAALLCLAAWRDPDSVPDRLAETKDPFTGKPLVMREEDGVLVFSSPGDGSEPIEARLRVR